MIKYILCTLLAYFLICVFLYLTQRFIMYHPYRSHLNPAAWGVPEMQKISLKTQDEVTLTAWYIAAQKGKPTLLYLHGNAGHIGYRGHLIKPYYQAGYGVLLLSYRGYGESGGKPTEKGLYDDGRSAMKYLLDAGVPSHCVVLFGESLGTAVATQLASEYDVGAMILLSGFTSMVDLGHYHYPLFLVKWLLRDRYDSATRIKELKTPSLFIHAEKDSIVPLYFGQQLFELASLPKDMAVLKGATHNNMPNQSIVKLVLAFLKKYEVCTEADDRASPSKK